MAPHNQSNTMKYFCARPVSEACKKGFLSTAGYTQHRNTKHAPASQLHRSPLIPEVQYNMPDNDNHQPLLPEAAYFIKHPVLDGVYRNIFFGSL